MSRSKKRRAAYKLMRLRKDGTLGPLFINASQVIPVGKWLKAEAHKTKGYAFRPGWHTCEHPYVPHLSMKGRVWALVEIADVKEFHRPAAQGGLWYLAQQMRVVEILN